MNKETAVLIVATELKTNQAYRTAWQKGITTAMANSLEANKLLVTSEIIQAAFDGAGLFLESVIAGAQTPEHGWVYNFK